MVATHSYVDYFAVFDYTEECLRANRIFQHMWRSSRVKGPPGSVIFVPIVS